MISGRLLMDEPLPQDIKLLTWVTGAELTSYTMLVFYYGVRLVPTEIYRATNNKLRWSFLARNFALKHNSARFLSTSNVKRHCPIYVIPLIENSTMTVATKPIWRCGSY